MWEGVLKSGVTAGEGWEKLAYARIMNSTCDMLTHKLSLTLSSSDVLVICIITFLIVFDICIARILSELSFFLVYARHMRTATLTFKPLSQSVISSARFSASMLSLFIDVSSCSVDASPNPTSSLGCAGHMLFSKSNGSTFPTHPRAETRHRPRSFSNPPSILECAGNMLFLKFNPTPSLISDPGSTFLTLRRQRAETR